MRTLSGGNQQKVCVSRWLVDGVTLLILEEPTRGVDVGARREIYQELRALADRGMAVLVLSSDVEEIAGISDRSIVLDRGRIVGRFEKGAEPRQPDGGDGRRSRLPRRLKDETMTAIERPAEQPSLRVAAARRRRFSASHGPGSPSCSSSISA